MRIRSFLLIVTMVCAVKADVIVDTNTVAASGYDDDEIIVLDYDDFDDEENVLVVRQRAVSPLSPSSRVIKSSEFQGKFPDLPSVLETVSGVDIRAMGGHGQYAESSIRGGTAMGARVYLDGVLLNSASGGAVDLSKIPLDRIREIRVTKSAAGLRQMGAGMGGVIELFTDNGGIGENKNITGVNLEAGSFGYIRGGAIVKRNQHQLNIDVSKSENNYPFTHDNGTTMPTIRDPDPTWDDTLFHKKNNFYRSIDAAYSVSIDVGGDHNITQRISAGAYEQGLFSYHYKNDQSGKTGGTTVMYGADYRGELTPRLTLGGEASGIYRGNSISDPDGRYFLGAAGRELESDAYTADMSADARYAVTVNLHAAGIAGARFQRYGQRDKMLGDSPKMFRQEYRAGIEVGYNSSPLSHLVGAGLAPARVFNDAHNNVKSRSHESALRVLYKYDVDTSTAGFDYWKAEGAKRTNGYPVAEAVTRINLHPVTLQLSASASKRAPTFFERFGWSSGFVSTPDLKEETRVEADFGASLDMGEWSAAASVFLGTVNDKIKSIPQSRAHVKVMNFADTKFFGAEIDGRVRFLRMFSAELSAAYMNSTISDAADPGWVGKAEPYIPEFSGFLKTEVDIGKITIGHGVRYESECYLNIENVARREAQIEFNAWVSYVVKDMLTLRYRVDNYLNNASFDFLDNPKPRRTHVVSLSLSL